MKSMNNKDSEILIRTENLTKIYAKTIVAVSRLNLEIKEGEIYGLLGPNGAGKTTTIRLLLGMTEPTAGQAWIDGNDCTRNAIDVKRITGYLPDNVGFYGDMTGRENLRFTGRLNNIPESELDDKITALLERAGIPNDGDKKVRTYSRGMKQRLGIADVLLKDPRIIILDEPTLGIDPEGVRQLIEIIQNLSKNDGRTLLISSHQLYQMQQICDRVGIFFEGKLVASGTMEELASESGVDETGAGNLDEIYHRYFERGEA